MGKKKVQGSVEYHPEGDRTLILYQVAMSLGLTPRLKEESSENESKLQ